MSDILCMTISINELLNFVEEKSAIYSEAVNREAEHKDVDFREINPILFDDVNNTFFKFYVDFIKRERIKRKDGNLESFHGALSGEIAEFYNGNFDEITDSLFHDFGDNFVNDTVNTKSQFRELILKSKIDNENNLEVISWLNNLVNKFPNVKELARRSIIYADPYGDFIFYNRKSYSNKISLPIQIKLVGNKSNAFVRSMDLIHQLVTLDNISENKRYAFLAKALFHLDYCKEMIPKEVSQTITGLKYHNLVKYNMSQIKLIRKLNEYKTNAKLLEIKIQIDSLNHLQKVGYFNNSLQSKLQP